MKVVGRSAIPLIWTYIYTTMNIAAIDSDFSSSDFETPMAGFGYGLPLSRPVRSIFVVCRVILALTLAYMQYTRYFEAIYV